MARATTISDDTLPSGLPAAELGFDLHGEPLRLPLGLVAPEGEEGRRLLASLPGKPSPPRWWAGRGEWRQPHLVVSTGALSLNSQVLPLLQAAEAAEARALVVLAPLVTDEALATLLVNDLARVFPRGILPLQTLVPEYHVEEAITLIAHLLGVAAWDGRPGHVQFARLVHLAARPEYTEVWRRSPSPLERLRRWLASAQPLGHAL